MSAFAFNKQVGNGSDRDCLLGSECSQCTSVYWRMSMLIGALIVATTLLRLVEI